MFRQPISNCKSASAALWAALRHYIVMFANSFGPPQDLAHARWLGPQSRADILAWLGPIEHLLRRLIYLDAIALDIAPRPAAQTQAPPRLRRTPAPREADLDRPETWRAPFRSMPAGRRGRTIRQASPSSMPARACAHLGIYASMPLAARYEACLRAFNAPAPYARRLARALAHKPARAEPYQRPPTRQRTRAAPQYQFADGCIAEAAELARPPRRENSS